VSESDEIKARTRLWNAIASFVEAATKIGLELIAEERAMDEEQRTNREVRRTGQAPAKPQGWSSR
jgi:hypothetical protein